MNCFCHTCSSCRLHVLIPLACSRMHCSNQAGIKHPCHACPWRASMPFLHTFKLPPQCPVVSPPGSRLRCSNQAGIKSAMLGKAGENAKLKFNAVMQTVRGVTV